MAGAIYAGAHGLTACMGLILIPLFLGFGAPVVLLAGGGSAALAEMGFNYVVIGVLDRGVAGSAYGIITRLLTFAFVPLLGLAHAMQTITDNNFGAGSYRRSDASLRTAVLAAFGYCLTLQIGMSVFAAPIGSAFVSAPVVVAEVARILPVISAGFFAAGPLMMIAMHYQAIGDAGRAAIFAMPLTYLLAGTMGEPGIWLASPLSEVLLLALTAFVLMQLAKQRSLRWGLFLRAEKVGT